MLTAYSQLARRYAKALFDLAAEKGELDKVADDINKVAEIVKNNNEVSKVLVSLVYSNNLRLQLMTTIIEKLELGHISKNFLMVLLDNSRINYLCEIIEYFSELVLENKGYVIAYVKAAKILNASDIKEIEEHLYKFIQKKVKAVVYLDENIIGGLVVTIGSRMWDGSILGQINRIHNQAKQAIDAA